MRDAYMSSESIRGRCERSRNVMKPPAAFLVSEGWGDLRTDADAPARGMRVAGTEHRMELSFKRLCV